MLVVVVKTNPNRSYLTQTGDGLTKLTSTQTVMKVLVGTLLSAVAMDSHVPKTAQLTASILMT